MLPVAFTPSAWTATLRRIARTALAGLVLVAGLHALPAAPAQAAADPRPAGISAAEVGPQVTVTGHAPSPSGLASATAASFAGQAPTEGTRGAVETTQPVTTGPDTGVTGPARAVAAAPVAGVAIVVVADPSEAAIARRGPPRA
ncbi:hypothetical protein [Micromonospora sp. DT31]|uniref:hypothetical protein n=1 Tax=Micromonospora sp. DT31 TaxID=3393434 RepID=UPI003CF1DE82